jgi:predicted nucleic acid-binding protein
MELEPIEKYKLALPDDQVDACLLALALNGGAIARTVRQMKGQGIKVSADQLADWRDKFPKRYSWHHTENSRRLEDDIVAGQRELIAAAVEAAKDAIAVEAKRIAAGDVKDASATARNLATVAGIGTTKILELTGRPTQITEVRKPEQIIAQLKQIGYEVSDVEGSADDDEAK